MLENKEINNRIQKIMSMDSERFFTMLDVVKPDNEYMANIDSKMDRLRTSGLGDKRIDPMTMFIRDYLIKSYDDDLTKKIMTTSMLFPNNIWFNDLKEAFEDDLDKLASSFNTTPECVKCKFILDEYRNNLNKNNDNKKSLTR